jgi:hypothetical protein
VEQFPGYDENPKYFLPGENRRLVLVSLVEYGKNQRQEMGRGRIRKTVGWRSKRGWISNKRERRAEDERSNNT